jgi:hypothetical protein
MFLFVSGPSSGEKGKGRGGRVLRYIKRAFLERWNLLLYVGGTALAAASPWPDALVPIVTGLELAYLTGMVGMPRFRAAVDAQEAAAKRPLETARQREAAHVTLQRMLRTLPPEAVQRFERLRQRCAEMRDITYGVRGHAGTAEHSAEAIRTPALDRLLYLFLKLLVSQAGLTRFLRSTTEAELTKRLEEVRGKLAAAQAGGDERVIRSLQDSVADHELRLDNYRKAAKDAQFVSIELDRIENKIQALVELGVGSQDPDFLSDQVTAAAESMQHTEATVNRLQHLTGLEDQLEDPPPILEADLGRLTMRER